MASRSAVCAGASCWLQRGEGALQDKSRMGAEDTSRMGRSPNEGGKTAIENPLAYYADLGFKVFPVHYRTTIGCSCKKEERCEKPGKHPAIKGYQQLASSSFERLTESRDLFGGRFQNHDIGALAGIEWFVLDSDDGEVEGLPRTWKARSASRGFHYFFKVPPGTVVGNIKQIVSGADIKGSGGMVVLPSDDNGREWVHAPHETVLADCPDWLLGAMRDHERVRDEIHSEVFARFDLASETIEEGARNDTLFKYACYLRSLSLEHPAIFSQ